MNIIKLLLTILLAVALLAPTVQAGWDANDEEKAEEAVAEFLKADSDLQTFFDKAYGYAVFYSVGKGAIGVGGAHGKGIVYAQGKATGNSKLTQVSIGFQLGGQSFREIIFFENKEAYQKFTSGKLEFSAQVSAVAVTAGASAGTNFKDGMAVFTMARGGLMYEASVGGQGFTFKPRPKE